MKEDLIHIVEKARAAKHGGFNRLSTGEKLAAALVLNRPDWLDSMGYTIAEAIDRLDYGWVECLRPAERIVNEE